jgi:hypothetical protein
VSLVAQTEVSNLMIWEDIENCRVASNDNVLIYEGKEYLLLKSPKDVNQTIVIPKSSLLYYSIRNPATFEKPSLVDEPMSQQNVHTIK